MLHQTALDGAAAAATAFSVPKHVEIGPEPFGIVVCRSVGTVSGILGLVLLPVRPKSSSKSKNSGRILKVFGALLAQTSMVP